MKKLITLFSVLLLLFACNKNDKTSCKIVKEGYIKCFDNGLTQENGKPYTCEPSTVIFFDNRLIFGNDKIFPDNKSSVFQVPFLNKILCSEKKYLDNNIFYKLEKYESSTITPDKKFILLSSSYSYPITDSAHGETFNSTIFLSTNSFDTNGFLHIDSSTEQNSKDIKKQIKSALISDDFPNGPDYLKIEGMTIIPDNKLLFGVREYGKAYRDFNYTITILSADYIEDENGIRLTGDIKNIYTFDPTTHTEDTLNLPVGLSSIEYSEFDKRIYLVTSFEIEENTKGIGAYLWYMTIDELNQGSNPHLIYDENNKPFTFLHKIEGLTILDSKKLFVIADDDRITGENEENNTFTKKLNQGYWAVLEIKN